MILLAMLALAADLPGPWASGEHVDFAVAGAAVHATWSEAGTIRYARIDDNSPPELVGTGAVVGDGGQMRPEVLVVPRGRPVVVYSTAEGIQVAQRNEGWAASRLGGASAPALFAATARGGTLLVSWIASDGQRSSVYVGTQKPKKEGGNLSLVDMLYKGGADGVCMCCKPGIASREKEVVVAFRDAEGNKREIHQFSSRDTTRWADMGVTTRGGWAPGGCPADGPVVTNTAILVSDGRSGKRRVYAVSGRDERELPPLDPDAEVLQPRALPDGSLVAWVEATPGMNRLVVQDRGGAPTVIAETATRMEPGDPVVVGDDVWFPWQGERAHVVRIERGGH